MSKLADDTEQDTFINSSLQKAELLLNDASSPLISNLRALSKYATQKLPETIDGYRAQIKDGNILEQPVDLNVMINEYGALTKSEEQLTKMDAQLSQVEATMAEKKSLLKTKAEKKAYQAWKNKAREINQAKHEAYIKDMYQMYLAEGEVVS